MRQVTFKAARQWWYAISNKEIPSEPMPETPRAIGERLAELGSERANYFFWPGAITRPLPLKPPSREQGIEGGALAEKWQATGKPIFLFPSEIWI
jgi:hypothetical protein